MFLVGNYYKQSVRNVTQVTVNVKLVTTMSRSVNFELNHVQVILSHTISILARV